MAYNKIDDKDWEELASFDSYDAGLTFLKSDIGNNLQYLRFLQFLVFFILAFNVTRNTTHPYCIFN